MSLFLCKPIIFVPRCRVRDLAKTSTVCTIKCISVSSDCNEQQSFTVYYLQHSLGFTQNSAVSVSKSVKFNASEKPDKAIEFLMSFGFTPKQISKLVKSIPKILTIDSDKIISPKLEFLLSKGISKPELVDRLSIYPNLLKRSLESTIVPSYEYMKTLFGSEENTIEAVKKYPDLLVYDINQRFGPNIATLQQSGVPLSNIVSSIKACPRVLKRCPVRFKEGVNEALRMGFDPKNSGFLVAVSAILQDNRESRVDLYKSLGWSEREISEAFLRNPWFMKVSEEKIIKFMDFLSSEMGFKPCDVAKFPGIFTYDLENRVIPRVSFYKALLSRGLVKKKQVFVSTLMSTSQKKFIEKFVTPYVEKCPELLKLYEENLGLLIRSTSDKVSA